MAKEVDLLSYWMPVLRQIRELREIAKAEEPEIIALLEACDRTLSNFFISTADAYGISRFEDIMGIIPDKEADLETRRFNVLINWVDNSAYTDEELYNRLVALCGEGKVTIDTHYEDYAIDITVDIGARGGFDAVSTLVLNMLPCNLVFILKNRMGNSSQDIPFNAGISTSTAMIHHITGVTI